MMGTYSLFCPTVGAILSGVKPGTSLYNVFIFSSRVCSLGQPARNETMFQAAHGLPSPIKANNNDREFFFPIQPQDTLHTNIRLLLT